MIKTTEDELARVLMALENDGRENMSAHDLAIIDAYENDAISIMRDAPDSNVLSYVGGGYARDLRGNYREAFWAGQP